MLALSNSGETAELADLVAHTRRFALPLVAITGRADSALAQAADVALILPKAAEACPMGLAPTTSTTMQLALGDAIAVALLTRRGFTAAGFPASFIPAAGWARGCAGCATSCMPARPCRWTARTCRWTARCCVMTEKRFGCLGIVNDDGVLIGIVTDGDLRRAMGPDLLSRRAGDIMTASPRTIGPDALAAEALHAMNARERAGHRAVRGGRRGPPGRHPACARPAAGGAGMSGRPGACAAQPERRTGGYLSARERGRATLPTRRDRPPAVLINVTKWVLPVAALVLLA